MSVLQMLYLESFTEQLPQSHDLIPSPFFTIEIQNMRLLIVRYDTISSSDFQTM